MFRITHGTGPNVAACTPDTNRARAATLAIQASHSVRLNFDGGTACAKRRIHICLTLGVYGFGNDTFNNSVREREHASQGADTRTVRAICPAWGPGGGAGSSAALRKFVLIVQNCSSRFAFVVRLAMWTSSRDCNRGRLQPGGVRHRCRRSCWVHGSIACRGMCFTPSHYIGPVSKHLGDFGRVVFNVLDTRPGGAEKVPFVISRCEPVYKLRLVQSILGVDSLDAVWCCTNSQTRS